MDEDIFDNVRWLVGAIARGIHSQEGPGAQMVLERLAEQDISQRAFREPQPQRLPVLRHLEAAVAQSLLVSADLAAALAAVADHLHWMQTPAYTDDVLGEGFNANYGWCQIVGPEGFFAGDDFLLGLLMLGPERHYRDHFHPAPELYWPLTGGSLWKKGDSGFAERPAGSLIWHEPNEIHATKTAEEPLLAVWAWTRDTATSARLAA